ncbi:MAG TPA: hypothetical protein VKT30_14480 [Caulobacteraceae bacterium]|nr:hypothetical protein [Caulobacteraceae bacterium]
MIGEQSIALQQIVAVSLLMIGSACMLGGYRIFAAGAGQKGHNAGPAGFFALVGALLVLLVAGLSLGPWRVRQDVVFPMHVVDLTRPLDPIARNAAPSSAGTAPSTH